ncbi:MAG: hypothetical protein ACRDHK_04845 [Actinomycetota bacterium]
MVFGPGPRAASSIDRILVPGILAGMVAAVPMGLFSMIAAATYQHRGFFTPMYHIASLLGDDTAARSLQEAASGDVFFFVPEPTIFGVAMHLVVGGFFGAIFSVVARAVVARVLPSRVVPSQASIIAVGVAYALLVMLLMSLVLVPAADAVLSGEERVSSFASVAGRGTFTIQHVIYGLVLGLWPVFRPQDFTSVGRAESEGS